MRLLEAVTSSANISSWYFQELFAQIESLINQGEYGGGAAFDSAALSALRAAASSFSTLPRSSAGERVLDESLNYPLSLLESRFAALIKEKDQFHQQLQVLLGYMLRDSLLIDQLLAAGALKRWVSERGRMENSTTHAWDFAMGYAPVTTAIAATDPANGVLYQGRPALLNRLSTDGLQVGLGPASNVRSIAPKRLSWKWVASPGEEFDQASGPDWARLSLLEPSALVSYSKAPAIRSRIPAGISASDYFEVRGQLTDGGIPISVRTSVEPRKNNRSIVVENAVAATNWSGTLVSQTFPVVPGQKIWYELYYAASIGADGTGRLYMEFLDESGASLIDAGGNQRTIYQPPVLPGTGFDRAMVQVPVDSRIAQARIGLHLDSHTAGTWSVTSARVHLPSVLSDYEISLSEDLFLKHGIDVYDRSWMEIDTSSVTVEDLPEGEYFVYFTEYFPCYQCSLNENHWSQKIMFDTRRPHPDGTVDFSYVPLGLDTQGLPAWFPLTDETGRSMGLELRPVRILPTDFLFTVYVPAAGQAFGTEATLEIELARPAYVTHLNLSPFSVYPAELRRVVVEGLSSLSSSTVFTGHQLVDQPMRIEFPRQLARRVFLTLGQENYTWKEHLLYSSDQLRRDALKLLEASLPMNLRRVGAQDPVQHIGAQYEIGLEALGAEDRANLLPSVQVLGPYAFTGCPSLIRLTADCSGEADFYLGFRAYDALGVERDVQLTGVPLPLDQAQVFPLASGLDPSVVARLDLYLKIVLRSNDALVERFLVEVL